jgi:hypothetical protein
MRTLLGAVALTVGGFLLPLIILAANQFPVIPTGVYLASGGLAVALTVTGFLLLRGSGPSGRWAVIVSTLGGGLAGLVLAFASKYVGIEGSENARLTVRVFKSVLEEVRGPALDLETRMVCWELGLDSAFIAVGALLGGLLGVVIRRLTVAS